MKKNKWMENLGLKVIAIVFAIFLWFIVVNVDDPVVNKVYRNIPVTITNEEVISNQGKTFQIIDNVGNINVTVYGKRSVLSKITANKITAVADLNQMEVNTLLVPITVNIQGFDGDFDSAIPSTQNLQIKIEEMIKNSFPISVSVTGTPRDGYVVGDLTTNPEKITIGGPESLVSSIQKVVAKVDVSGMSKSTTLDAQLYYYDGNGNVVDQSQMNNNLGDGGASVNVEILNTKNVKLEFYVSGTPAEGYMYLGYSSEPESVQVCGTKENLDNFTVLSIPADQIDVEGLSAKKDYTIDITPYLPEGVQLVDNTANNVVVNVMIEQEGARTIELPVESIQINNLSEDLKVEFEKGKELEFKFIGSKEALEKLDIRNAVSLNLKTYTTPGTYEIPVAVEALQDVSLENNPVVKVNLTKK